MSNIKSADKKQLCLNNTKTIAGLLEQMKGEIARCLPKHITPDRMARIAMTELRKNPRMSECDPMSFIAAIMQASQLGLEPGIMGSCYLIPFFNSKLGKFECTFMPGYRGFLDLARRSGQIKSLVARAVYENDVFEYEYGLQESVTHKPAMDERGELRAVYAVALLKDGGHQFEVMSKREIEAVRQKSQGKNAGPWTEYYDEMARKTVVRKLFKWLPCSVEMQKAVSLDELQEIGKQNIKAAASEEFDMDFVIDAETGEVTEMPKANNLNDLIAQNKSKEKAKAVDPETGEVLPDSLQS
jgi:recombination protein RecT